MGDEPIRIDSDRLRIDFKIVGVEEDVDGNLDLDLVPNPDRYEWRDEDGERVLWDRNTETLIPEDVVKLAMDNMSSVPMFAPPENIPSAEKLMMARKAVVQDALDGKPVADDYADPAGETFAAKVGENLWFVVISVDLVGSTRLQAENAEAYNMLVPILSKEISDISAHFGGLIIKFTGDGAIIGFPEPGLNVCADMAFDAATAIAASVYAVVNPLAKAAGLPAIRIRIGADANKATVVPIGGATNRRAADVLGIVVSLAAKVESGGEPDEIWIGQTLYENLGVERQAYLTKAPSKEGWDFTNRDGKPYRLYRMSITDFAPGAGS